MWEVHLIHSVDQLPQIVQLLAIKTRVTSPGADGAVGDGTERSEADLALSRKHVVEELPDGIEARLQVRDVLKLLRDRLAPLERLLDYVLPAPAVLEMPAEGA